MINLKRISRASLLLFAIVLSSPTFGQTNDILVPRDSLYNVFVNYDISKAKVAQLKMDTIGLRFAINKLKGSNYDLSQAIGEYKFEIIPKKDTIIINLEKENELLGRQARIKYLKGAKDMGIIGLMLYGIFSLVK